MTEPKLNPATLRWPAPRALLVVGALVLSGTASAYTLIGADWAWRAGGTAPEVKLNVSSFPASIGTPQEVEDALRAAVEVWNTEPESPFQYARVGVTQVTSWQNDGQVVVQHHNQFDAGSTVARAQWWFNVNDFTDCDVRFYPGNMFGLIDWSASPAGATATEYDLARTAIHEIGHCAGLEHVSDIAAIMYPNSFLGTGPADRTINEDDEAGIRRMYGADAGTGLVVHVREDVRVGAPFTVRMSGAIAGESIYLLASQAGVGPGPCPQILGGACVGLRGPITVVRTLVADRSGEATWSVILPQPLARVNLGMQIAVLRGPGNADSELSEAIVVPVNP